VPQENDKEEEVCKGIKRNKRVERKERMKRYKNGEEEGKRQKEEMKGRK
jgi:hypothetical protein